VTSREPQWLLESSVLAIHHEQLAEHGGLDGVRDPGLLSSALMRPRNLFAYTPDAADLQALAASYAFGIARNHPFLDGNKRTAYVACRTFLIINGADFQASPSEKYDTFLALAEGQLTEDDLAAWLREHAPHPDENR